MRKIDPLVGVFPQDSFSRNHLYSNLTYLYSRNHRTYNLIVDIIRNTIDYDIELNKPKTNAIASGKPTQLQI